jgi:NADH-quinone oxidoreductase subunit K
VRSDTRKGDDSAAAEHVVRHGWIAVWGDPMIGLSHYLVLGAILFAISVVGIFLNRKNVIILLMAIELNLLAVNMNFIAFSHYLQDVAGQIFVFFILTVAAAESAIGLAILVCLFRNIHTINVDDLDTLKE